MKKELGLLKFALKEQMEYKRNFMFGIFFMVLNDITFLSLFMIFLSYFKWIWMSMWDIFLIWSFTAFSYWIIHGIFANLALLSTIIENGKLDYYLSLPSNFFKVVSFTKINAYWIWDLVFWLIAFLIYYFVYTDGNYFILIKRLVLIMLICIFIVWFAFLISSISFWVDRWSQISHFIEEFLVTFSTWPFKIYENKRVVYIIVSLVWLYPSLFLPFNIIKSEFNLYSWILVVSINIFVFISWIWLFNKWLKKYTSWNLINQM